MKKKVFYISVIVISLALIMTGVIFLFVVNYNVSIPDMVTITTSSNKTYIKASLNDNSYGYIYRFIGSSGTVKTIETPNNILCADTLMEKEILTLGETYNISVRYKNEYRNGYSNYSKSTTWLASKFLSRPDTFVVQNYDDAFNPYDERIEWSYVDNATKFKVFYSCGDEIKTIETTDYSIALKDIEGGIHNFYVIAMSDEDKYLDSEMSNVVSATAYHEIKPFLSAKFSPITKKLIISSVEDISDVEVYLGTNINDARRVQFSYQGEASKNFTKTKTQFGYELTINLFALYSEENTYIAVKPIPSGYNVFNGSVLTATINN